MDNEIFDNGYEYGLSGQHTPDDNPYGFTTEERYVWGEGFFDGYKQFLNDRTLNELRASLLEENNND